MSLMLPVALFWPLLVLLLSGLRLAMEQGGRHRWKPRQALLDGWWISAPLPALALALWPGELSLAMESWLLGGLWQLDAARRPWLLFSALLWFLAGCYARGYLAGEQREAEAGDEAIFRRLLRFALLWPLTLFGNLLLIVAEDIPSFYMGFVIMTLAAYGLVVHTGDRDARLGGLAYIVMALVGEALILGGLLWSAGSAEALTLSELRAGIAEADQGLWMASLLWLGFGVKAGVIGLHVWLPLAHPVAPTPASAVLSGVMVKAGVLGWLYTLPLGNAEAGLARLGETIIAVGLIGAFVAALLGVAQRHPKAVLAYSSVSQLGMLTSLVGVGLSTPALWPALLAPMTLFAGHHGMTKGALFLGVGISEHPPRLPAWLIVALLVLPALSLGGALASGLVAKGFMKEVLYEGGHSALVSWLSLAAVGSTLLMVRALWRQWRRRGEPATSWRSPMFLAWLFAVLAAAAVPWWLPIGEPGVTWPSLKKLPGLLWPAVLGLVLAGLTLLAAKAGGRARRVTDRLPAGDLWWAYLALAKRVAAGLRRAGAALESRGQRVRECLRVEERRAMAWLDDLARHERTFIHMAVPLMVGVAVLLALGFWLG
ncbi:proton-conducting transporter membrane subunit [Halomonas sp. LR3S48]|uniref:complex I subunit 5 family protein n=1 Tax=Halomonas sp. LR3S48 TaxID=2982694 RepID=UPI0021E4FD05|nr:proton-conducting transporter membrane subunit [Halomonas sp. LR3S48]UYG04918.1 proton-conducting transporter membrane subunit [Halomonas sp. LR3S48]